MRSDVELIEVLKISKETLNNELSKYSTILFKIDIITDDEKCYRVIIEWERCIGEMVVEEPHFAPYRFICFNILSSITEDITSIYCWYDSKGDSFDVIKEKIKEGISIAFEY